MSEDPFDDIQSGEEAEEFSGTDFFQAVMGGLADTNFAHGWASTAMYNDFLAWCESSPDADAIITSYFAQMPTLVMDAEEGVRLISLRVNVATELMKALLDAFEEKRIQEFLER